MKIVYEIPASPCPTCGHLWNQAYSKHDATAPPAVGDGTFCHACGEFLVFDSDLIRKLPTPSQVEAIKAEGFWPRVEAAQKTLRERAERRKKTPEFDSPAHPKLSPSTGD